jgi:peptide deformylase
VTPEEQTAALAPVDAPQAPAEAEAETGAAQAPPELAPEVKARRDAALRHVRQFGDPALRSKARAVERFDEALRREVERMARIMSDALGVGLAATQVGVQHRLLVYRAGADGPVLALVNPRIEWSGAARETMEEGCLSLPGAHVDVERAIHVRIGARDPQGDALTVEASGLEARVLQHEIDHLDGVLILDRTSREQRKQAVRAMREAERGGAPPPVAHDRGAGAA